jgi:hypothetical protein
MSNVSLPAPRRELKRSHSGLAWFGAMVGGWLAFFALLLVSEQALGDLWHGIRDLPLLVEGLVWLLAFPFVLALGIWDSAWETALRLLLVSGCAIGWSLVFWPRKERTS